MSENQDFDHNNGERPVGMEVRRRRVRKKRRVSDGASSRAREMNEKGQQLLREAQDDGPVDLAEQLRRLKEKEEKPLDEVWGTRRKSSSWLWIVLLGLVTTVVAVVAAVTLFSGDEEVVDDEEIDLGGAGEVETDDMSQGPLAWFDAGENSLKVLDEAKEMIGKVNGAKDVEEISELIRSSAFRKNFPVKLDDWGVERLTNSIWDWSWQSFIAKPAGEKEENGIGVVKVNGKDVEGQPYSVYFVNEGGKLLIDWDATMGWSEASIGELKKSQSRKSTMVRTKLEKKWVYDQKFGRIDYSGYALTGDESEEFILAYVPLNTPEGKERDRLLKRILNYGNTYGKKLLKDQDVTLEVRFGSTEGNQEIFEITDFLHAGWVSPLPGS